MTYSVYILYSEKYDRFYTGSSQDVQSRLVWHNAGRNKSTKSYIPWVLVYTESFTTLSEARRRERQIKSWKNRNYMIDTLDIRL